MLQYLLRNRIFSSDFRHASSGNSTRRIKILLKRLRYRASTKHPDFEHRVVEQRGISCNECLSMTSMFLEQLSLHLPFPTNADKDHYPIKTPVSTLKITFNIARGPRGIFL
jgi:hypothetical protein